MIKTGITRRIDELGRIVIPKEIRKNLRIKNSDELDIIIDGENIILNKHEVNVKDFVIEKLLYTIGRSLNKNVLLTSKDKIISSFFLNSNKDINIEINDEIMNIINERKSTNSNNLKIKTFGNNSFLINPITINGDLFGSIISYGLSEVESNDEDVMKFCQLFLENYLE